MSTTCLCFRSFGARGSEGRNGGVIAGSTVAGLNHVLQIVNWPPKPLQGPSGQ